MIIYLHLQREVLTGKYYLKRIKFSHLIVLQQALKNVRNSMHIMSLNIMGEEQSMHLHKFKEADI